MLMWSKFNLKAPSTHPARFIFYKWRVFKNKQRVKNTLWEHRSFLEWRVNLIKEGDTHPAS